MTYRFPRKLSEREVIAEVGFIADVFSRAALRLGIGKRRLRKRLHAAVLGRFDLIEPSRLTLAKRARGGIQLQLAIQQ